MQTIFELHQLVEFTDEALGKVPVLRRDPSGREVEVTVGVFRLYKGLGPLVILEIGPVVSSGQPIGHGQEVRLTKPGNPNWKTDWISCYWLKPAKELAAQTSR